MSFIKKPECIKGYLIIELCARLQRWWRRGKDGGRQEIKKNPLKFGLQVLWPLMEDLHSDQYNPEGWRRRAGFSGGDEIVGETLHLYLWLKCEYWSVWSCVLHSICIKIRLHFCMNNKKKAGRSQRVALTVKTSLKKKKSHLRWNCTATVYSQFFQTSNMRLYFYISRTHQVVDVLLVLYLYIQHNGADV